MKEERDNGGGVGWGIASDGPLSSKVMRADATVRKHPVWIVEGCIKCISCEVNNHNRNNNKNNRANIRIEFFSVLCYIKSGESCLFYDSVAFLSVTLTDLSENFMFCRVTLFRDCYFNTSKSVNEKDFLRTGKTFKKNEI